MERYEIKKVTEGQYKNKSLIFHLVDMDRNNFEFVIANTNLKIISSPSSPIFERQFIGPP